MLTRAEFITRLRAKLLTGAYPGMSNVQAAAALNIERNTVRKALSRKAIQRQWWKRQILARCWVIANTQTATLAQRALCFATYQNIMTDVFDDIDTGDALLIDFPALIALNVLTTNERDATLALADVQALWVEEVLEIPNINATDVAEARA